MKKTSSSIKNSSKLNPHKNIKTNKIHNQIFPLKKYSPLNNENPVFIKNVTEKNNFIL